LYILPPWFLRSKNLVIKREEGLILYTISSSHPQEH
jgi:hypothetical protein